MVTYNTDTGEFETVSHRHAVRPTRHRNAEYDRIVFFQRLAAFLEYMLMLPLTVAIACMTWMLYTWSLSVWWWALVALALAALVYVALRAVRQAVSPDLRGYRADGYRILELHEWVRRQQEARRELIQRSSPVIA